MTQEDRVSALIGCARLSSVGVVGRQIRSRITLRCDGERKYSTEVTDSTLSRKASSEDDRCPYRKPTQVGEERILRCAREPSLRNSAN